MTDRKVRFKDFIWNQINYDKEITVIGAGGIGSFTLFFLTRIDNFKIILYDHDSFELHNTGGQLVSMDKIGANKAEAMVDICAMFSSPEKPIYSIPEKFDSECEATPIMFVLPDNMKVRKEAFDLWKELPDREIFIEGRLLGEIMTVFCVTPGKEDDYEKYLFNDNEVDPAPCTMKGTSHSAAMIGSIITSWFNNWCCNKVLNDDLYTVPFKTDFNLANPMSYKLE